MARICGSLSASWHTRVPSPSPPAWKKPAIPAPAWWWSSPRVFSNRLLQRGYPHSKLTLIPNGANLEMFTFSPGVAAQVRQALNLGDKFVAIYAGIHGVAQGLETVIEAARLLKDDPDIHILLVGDGPRKSSLAELAESLHLPNLTLLPEQPREKIVDYLSAADIALIPLRNLDLFKGALPSKMFDAWACERPILLNVDGEARQVMEQAGGGVFVPPEDPTPWQKPCSNKAQPEECRQMGVNGRRVHLAELLPPVPGGKISPIIRGGAS